MTEHERFINEYCRNVGNIKIRCDDCKFVDNCVDYGWDGCKKFTPTPSEPMTNEEWFCNLSTEEKATFLAIQIRLGVEFYRTNDERYQNHDWWAEWLKQPYND